MDPKTAFLALALCFAADEAGTRLALRAGARETMIQKPAIRYGVKLSILPLFAKKRKKGWLLLPAVYCGAGAWNGLVVAPEMQRRRGQGR